MKRTHPLRLYRASKNLSCEELAKTLGIAASTVRSFENGNREVSAEMACLIEARIGIDRTLLRPDLFMRVA